MCKTANPCCVLRGRVVDVMLIGEKKKTSKKCFFQYFEKLLPSIKITEDVLRLIE